MEGCPMPLDQGDFGTCVAYAFAQTVAVGVRNKYGVALDANKVVEKVKTLCPCWNGSNTELMPSQWNAQVDANPDGASFDIGDGNIYLIKVDSSRINTFQQAYRDISRSQTMLYLTATISYQQGLHSVALMRIHPKLDVIQALNSWGASEMFMNVTQSNFQYAMRVEPEIVSVKQNTVPVAIPAVEDIFTATLHEGIPHLGRAHTYTLPNGQTYVDEWVNGQKHGLGKTIYADGSTYEGQWNDGKKHGQGKYTNADGHTYEGQWAEGEKHGQGKETLAADLSHGSIRRIRLIYEGQWAEGKKHGLGKETLAVDGSILHTYEGQLNNGKKHGQGKYTNADGHTYEGQWAEGEKHGQGKETLAVDGSIVQIYEGQWTDGQPHGQGTEIDADGGTYEGQYADGKQHGQGKERYADGVTYEGNYVDDKRHGQGKYIRVDGYIYEGQWAYDNPHGQGTETYADGSIYEGQWNDGKKQGQGTQTPFHHPFYHTLPLHPSTIPFHHTLPLSPSTIPFHHTLPPHPSTTSSHHILPPRMLMAAQVGDEVEVQDPGEPWQHGTVHPVLRVRLDGWAGAYERDEVRSCPASRKERSPFPFRCSATAIHAGQ
jgi:hypothetical protein